MKSFVEYISEMEVISTNKSDNFTLARLKKIMSHYNLDFDTPKQERMKDRAGNLLAVKFIVQAVVPELKYDSEQDFSDYVLDNRRTQKKWMAKGVKSYKDYIKYFEKELKDFQKEFESFTKDLKSNESGTKMKVSDSKIGNNLAWVTMMVKK